MKKTLLCILAIGLCIALCACGKSNQAQKADELILSIGNVSLENEAAIIAAKAYYDTLTDKQKAQVENAAVLESAVQELDALKKEKEYVETYNRALKYESNLQMDDAYSEYEKLPENYEDVSQRMNKIAPYVGVAGVWVCNNYTSTSNKGTEFGAIFKEITVELKNFPNDKIGISYTGTFAPSEYVNRSIIVVAGRADILYLIDTGGLLGDIQKNEDGSKKLGYGLAGTTEFGQLKTTFTITAENKMIVEYTREKGNNKTTVAFVYSKRQ